MRTDDRRHAREQTQEATLDAAERLAGFEGVAGLSLKRLAEEAGLSTMIIYSHFGDRYGLEEALLRRAFRSLVGVVEETGSKGTSVTVVAEAIRMWSHAHPAQFSMVFAGAQSLDSGLQSLGRQLLADVAELVRQQLGWASSASGLALLAALFGFLTVELRGQIDGDTAATFGRLAESLQALPLPRDNVKFVCGLG